MADQPEKIELHFDSCQAMLDHAQMLLDEGYRRRGNWSLGQAASHVADWMRYPLDGFPKPPLPVRLMMLVMKYTVAPGMKRRILANGFKPGIPTAPESVAAEDAMPDADGIKKLRETVARIEQHEGELIPSPLFGHMDKAMLQKVTRLHAEHHFGYLQPLDATTEA